MKPWFLLFMLCIFVSSVFGQQNVGREYGTSRMPILISHIPEKNRRMIYRGNSPPHNFFTKIICFKWPCRNTARRNKDMHAISFERYVKGIKKNARKGHYKYLRRDSIPSKKPVVKRPEEQLVKADPMPTALRNSDVAAPILKKDSLIVLNEFLFESNSAALRREQFAALDSIMDFLLRYSSLTVKVTGHTDNTGRENHNKTLSTNRAKVVAEYLIENGVESDRISYEGLGSTKPVDTNATVKGRGRNRRVELLIHER